MPLFVYKCDTCGRTVEEFRKVEDREEEKFCSEPITNVNFEKLLSGNFNLGDRDITNAICPGKLIFQPIQRTTFTFHGRD